MENAEAFLIKLSAPRPLIDGQLLSEAKSTFECLQSCTKRDFPRLARLLGPLAVRVGSICVRLLAEPSRVSSEQAILADIACSASSALIRSESHLRMQPLDIEKLLCNLASKIAELEHLVHDLFVCSYGD